MEANPEVMPVASKPIARPASQPAGEVRGNDASARHPDSSRAVTMPRTSEDPMRRTDRYRLVMPWDSRL